MYGMTPMGVFFTAIFPLEIKEQALCQQLQVGTQNGEYELSVQIVLDSCLIILLHGGRSVVERGE